MPSPRSAKKAVVNVATRRRLLVATFAISGPLSFCAALAENPRSQETRLEAAAVDYDRDVRPVLARSCFACHGPDEQQRQAGLRLDRQDAATVKLDSGARAILPENPGTSELVARIESDDADVRMPPPETTPVISPDEQRLIRRWIEQGAIYNEHWSYVQPQRPPLPQVRDREWPRNEIDYFILARLESESLAPAPEADRARLLRRVYLDLVGLPPSVEEVDRFLADSSADAYERVVGSLLDSPHYGERWARPWLDLARHADSNGYQRDGFRDVWAYRDWVVAAMNLDMPFDQFTIEQLAGDLLPDATLSQRIATGFHRSTTVNVEAGTDQEEDRFNTLFDRVNTTGTVWLGTTLECAQCHDHKYDPFGQRDYYRLLAYFNNSPLETEAGDGSRREFVGPKVTLPEPPERQQERAQLVQQRKGEKQRLDEMIAGALAEQPAWEAQMVAVVGEAETNLPPALVAALAVEPDVRTGQQQKVIRDHLLAERPEIGKLRTEMERLDKRIAALEPQTALVMQEMAEPRTTHVLERGEFLSPGEAVRPGVPEILHAVQEDGHADRLSLARWLVEAENPLVGRVTVNRWWAEFFGRGLVRTLEDFGTQGERPTHPDLLDWLAVEFVEGGWSRKAIHRLIVTSATYRQRSNVGAESHERDPHNELYARGPRLRLDAETIRDNALAVSGLLSPAIGGPPVKPRQPEGIWRVTGVVDNTYTVSNGEDRYRRGLYVIWRRSSPYPSFVNFDAPDRASCVVQRPRTNTPLQALTLLNDPVYVEAAFALAARVLRECPDDATSARARYAFRLCLGREPNDRELLLLCSVANEESARYADDHQAVRALTKGHECPAGIAPVELAAWFHVATILLNLDETITKG